MWIVIGLANEEKPKINVLYFELLHAWSLSCGSFFINIFFGALHCVTIACQTTF